MAPDDPDSGVPRSGDEMREEFRLAQRRRVLKRGIWRDTDLPHEGPRSADSPPPAKTD